MILHVFAHYNSACVDGFSGSLAATDENEHAAHAKRHPSPYLAGKDVLLIICVWLQPAGLEFVFNKAVA